MGKKIIDIDIREFSARGKQVYEGIKAGLEPEHKGEIVAIEPDSGDYFLGKTVGEAGEKAKEKYPDKIFYFVRVGHRAVHVLRRTMAK
ncbi:MAG: hypothetical protein ACE5MB_03060 [Anaerolineae bacterium]